MLRLLVNYCALRRHKKMFNMMFIHEKYLPLEVVYIRRIRRYVMLPYANVVFLSVTYRFYQRERNENKYSTSWYVMLLLLVYYTTYYYYKKC